MRKATKVAAVYSRGRRSSAAYGLIIESIEPRSGDWNGTCDWPSRCGKLIRTFHDLVHVPVPVAASRLDGLYYESFPWAVDDACPRLSPVATFVARNGALIDFKQR